MFFNFKISISPVFFNLGAPVENVALIIWLVLKSIDAVVK